VGLWLALLAVAALVVRRRWPGPQETQTPGDNPTPQAPGHNQREWSRKLVHIGTGAVVPLAWLFGIEREIALAAAAAVTLLAALNHRLRLLPAVEDVGRRSYGTVAYGAAITVLLWQYWPQQAACATAGVVGMALGDGLAGLLGSAWPSPSWRVLGQRRSLLGTATMALATLLGLGLLALLAGGPSLPALVAIAIGAALLEQVAIAGLDNLSVPLAVAWLWQQLS
jgi:phytol kinase